ncbi:hypothetical protein FKM82_031399, partial [Ascaphus truei]
VLKILLSLWAHGASQFVQDLRRNALFIQQAAAVSGPPDPFHGNSLYQKVRCAAQELVGSLFSDAYAPPLPVVQPSARTQTGNTQRRGTRRDGEHAETGNTQRRGTRRGGEHAEAGNRQGTRRQGTRRQGTRRQGTRRDGEHV